MNNMLLCAGHTQVRILDLMVAEGLSLLLLFKTLKENNTKTLNKSCRNLLIIVLVVCFGTIPAQINVTEHKD